VPTPQDNGDPIQLYDYLGVGQTNQLWKVESIESDWVHLVCVASGKVLDAVAPSVGSNGCLIQLWDNLGDDESHYNQHWEIVSSGAAGAVFLICRASPGKVLDATLESVDQNGCVVQLWDRFDPPHPNQTWKINSVGGGANYISSADSGKVLDAKNEPDPPKPPSHPNPACKWIWESDGMGGGSWVLQCG